MNRLSDISTFLSEQDIHTVVILTDQHVDARYPNYFQDLYSRYDVHKLVIPAGEDNKDLRQATVIWQYLTDITADKNILMLNFGGGMICDLGGFAASTYKRGVRFAHYPTTLLAMIDASIGGKNGINFNNIKNCIGIIRQPDCIFTTDLSLLQTLSPRELQSGLGEMIKYALIGNQNLFQKLSNIQDFTATSITQVDINTCITLKRHIVKRDPEDLHERHVLNFGHTIGHAFESYFAEKGQPIPHGVAVAYGLWYESRLSHRFGTLTEEELSQIENLINKHFTVPVLNNENLSFLLPYMQQDKKNESNMVNISLLEHIGKAVPDFFIDVQLLTNVLLQDCRQIHID